MSELKLSENKDKVKGGKVLSVIALIVGAIGSGILIVKGMEIIKDYIDNRKFSVVEVY